jgi:hypothetical protein
MRAIERLAGDLMEQIAQGLDTHKLLQTMRKLLWGIEHEIPGFMDEVMKKNAELRSALSNAPPETIATVEARLRGTEDILDEVVCFHRSLVQYLDRRQLGSKRARAGAADKLEPRNGTFSPRSKPGCHIRSYRSC